MNIQTDSDSNDSKQLQTLPIDSDSDISIPLLLQCIINEITALYDQSSLGWVNSVLSFLKQACSPNSSYHKQKFVMKAPQYDSRSSSFIVCRETSVNSATIIPILASFPTLRDNLTTRYFRRLIKYFANGGSNNIQVVQSDPVQENKQEDKDLNLDGSLCSNATDAADAADATDAAADVTSVDWRKIPTCYWCFFDPLARCNLAYIAVIFGPMLDLFETMIEDCNYPNLRSILSNLRIPTDDRDGYRYTTSINDVLNSRLQLSTALLSNDE